MHLYCAATRDDLLNPKARRESVPVASGRGTGDPFLPLADRPYRLCEPSVAELVPEVQSGYTMDPHNPREVPVFGYSPVHRLSLSLRLTVRHGAGTSPRDVPIVGARSGCDVVQGFRSTSAADIRSATNAAAVLGSPKRLSWADDAQCAQ